MFLLEATHLYIMNIKTDLKVSTSCLFLYDELSGVTPNFNSLVSPKYVSKFQFPHESCLVRQLPRACLSLHIRSIGLAGQSVSLLSKRLYPSGTVKPCKILLS